MEPFDSRLEQLRELDPKTAAESLENDPDQLIADLLSRLHTGYAVEILEEFEAARRESIAAATPFGQGQLWLKGHHFDEGTVGRLMERPPAVFRPATTIQEVIVALREIVKKQMVTYIFVTDQEGKLLGVVTFRELLFAQDAQPLAEIMIAEPFFLKPEATLIDAMQEVVTRHYPVYPVCDAERRLLGLVKGQTLFEQQAFEISAQAGSMVGVEKMERLATPWARSLKFRHPWLQLNLITAFLAAFVVGLFADTMGRIAVLAAFLPVLSGPAGNAGSQALAITIRGITLGEMRSESIWPNVVKEAWLGLLNGLLVGLVAGVGMYVYASMTSEQYPAILAFTVFAAMSVSCLIGGIAGTLIPLSLKRLGADPATASSIFLSTATDIVSMGSFLALCTLFLS